VNRELEKAVAGLYRAFADVPQPVQVTGCTNCCISQEELARLVEVPREALTADDLRSYADNVPDTVGTEADFRYFLPRMFELVAEGELLGLGDGWVVRRLQYTAWTHWPDDQVQAIRAYLMAWWTTALGELGEHDLEEIMASLGRIESSLESYLAVWLKPERAFAIRLAEFVLAHITALALGKTWDVWAPKAASAQVYQWLQSGLVAAWFRQLHDDDPSAPEAPLLIEAAALVTP
jgi:hypothetical protein